MTGTTQLARDKNIFNEKNIDDIFELKIINIEEMWKLREALDLWKFAQRKHKRLINRMKIM